MEKLGVVLDDEKTKVAGQTKKCPKCGADLHSESTYCVNCGTEPFEKRPENIWDDMIRCERPTPSKK